MGFVVEAAFILFEVILLLTLFTYLPAIIRSVKKSSLPLLFSLAVFVNFVVCNKKIYSKLNMV